MSRGKNFHLPSPLRRMIAPMQKVDVLAKNWFIIKKVLRVLQRPLSNWQLNMG